MNAEDIKKLVVLRLETMPENMRVALGSFGELNKYQLVDHVKREDELGQLIIEMQLKYLKAMKDFNA